LEVKVLNSAPVYSVAAAEVVEEEVKYRCGH
jgi:hypothetical protein